MELEKIKAIIAEVLNIDADSITEDTTFFRLLWGLKRSMTLNWIMNLSNRFRQSVMLLKQFGQLNKNVTVRQSEI